MAKKSPEGFLYLIHLDGKLADHAEHYLGWTLDVSRRFDEHAAGQGSPLLRAAAERGIPFWVVRVWADKTRTDERRLKNQKNGPFLCPLCGPGRRQRQKARVMAQRQHQHRKAA